MVADGLPEGWRLNRLLVIRQVHILRMSRMSRNRIVMNFVLESLPMNLETPRPAESCQRFVCAERSPVRPQLAEAVLSALHQSEHPALRHVEVAVEGDHVLLRGWVPSYYLKQCAQVAAMKVAGVRTVHNVLRVPPR